MYYDTMESVVIRRASNTFRKGRRSTLIVLLILVVSPALIGMATVPQAWALHTTRFLHNTSQEKTPVLSFGQESTTPPRIQSGVTTTTTGGSAAGVGWVAPNPELYPSGGIFSFGNAFSPSANLANQSLGTSIVGGAASPAVTGNTQGLYLVGSNGSVYTFGDAVYQGSLGGVPLGSSSFPAPIVGMAVTPSGNGYYLVGSNGSVYTFGDAVYQGSLGGVIPDVPISGMALSATGLGYWLLSPEGIRTVSPSPVGTTSSALGEAIVNTASSQIAPASIPGTFCNPYGPCEPWCVLFATWVWRQVGIQIPLYPFVGSVYDWGASNGHLMSPSSLPQPGDAILYGTGPQTVQTAVHMGIVAQVWPDGFIDTIEGDAGPGNNGEYGVVMNGPFLPSSSSWYNGFPVFAYVTP